MLKALIVDDDIAVIRCFDKLIKWQELGYDKVYTATNGKEAYKIAVEEKVDVVISDLKMPIMGGVELARLLREDNLKTEIILLTAYEDFSAAREGIELKIYDYILKPLVAETIDRLSNNLKHIALKNHNTSWGNSFIKDELHEKIFSAFKKSDTEYLKSIINKIELLADGSNDNHVFQLATVKMIDIICNYLRELSFADSSIQSNREEMQKFMTEFSSPKDITDMLWKKIKGIIYVNDKSENKRMHANIVLEIKSYISRNYMNCNFCIADISKAFHYSTDHINRLFKNSEGITASKYIINLRMEKAKILILDSDMSINDIAEAVGYNSLSYFTSSFKSFFGMSPTAIRERNRNIKYYTQNDRAE